MALTQDEKILVAQYVTAGLITREIADRLLSGRVTKAEMSIFRTLVRTAGGVIGREAMGLGRLAVRAAPMVARGGVSLGRMAARTNPWTLAALLAYEGYVHRDEIAAVAERLGAREAPAEQEALQESVAIDVQRGLIGGPSPFPALKVAVKRKVSKANKAVKKGMQLLKAGTKAATGARPGILPVAAFRISTKAAGLANPRTKSKPGKGKSIINKLARRLKKWW